MKAVEHIIDKLVYHYHRYTLWKRFGFGRCEICDRLTFIRHEIGLGNWVCNKEQCCHTMNDLVILEIERYRVKNPTEEDQLFDYQGYITVDKGEKNIIEY